MNSRYILKDKVPVECPDLHTWGKWMETADRHVDRTEITPEIEVSTVFLGLDHNWGEGSPVLFETMIFGGTHAEEQDRYTTWEDAEAGHKRAVALARGDSL